MRHPPTGIRISLRYVDPHGTASDLVGEVVAADDLRLVILPWDRGPRTVGTAAVVAWRPVPPKTVRPSSTPADLARLAARGWPGLELERLGGWELRAGGGYTRRANSALCEGDPGTDVAGALDRVTAFYRSRGLPPQVMLPARAGERHRLYDLLVRGGWAAHSPTWLMTRDLRSAPGVPLPPDVRVSWSAHPDPAWLAAFGRPHPLREAVLTAADADYLTAGRDGEPVGIARLALTGEWAGFAGLWVAARAPRGGPGHGPGEPAGRPGPHARRPVCLPPGSRRQRRRPSAVPAVGLAGAPRVHLPHVGGTPARLTPWGAPTDGLRRSRYPRGCPVRSCGRRCTTGHGTDAPPGAVAPGRLPRPRRRGSGPGTTR